MHLCSKLGSLALLTAVLGMAASMVHTSSVHPDFRTGKLVRSVIVTSKRGAGEVAQAAPLGIDTGFDAAVERIAAQHSLPPQLIHSVIKVESNYNPLAVSPKGARGLMQLIPSTARRFGVSDSFNPLENIQGGAKYLKYLLDLYNGNYPLALAAYNAGEGAVAKYGGVPPYAETRNYLVLVQKHLAGAGPLVRATPYARPAAAQNEKPADLAPARTPHIQEVTRPDGTVQYIAR
jgi:soluble lytic murein transglycosylase-like protein